MAIQLKPLTIEDYEVYNRYYKLANYEGYQTNFHSLQLWNNVYHTQFYYNEHFLITLMHYEDFYFWNLPLTTTSYLKEAIDTILDYCNAQQLPFLMDGILPEQEALLEQLYPNRFTFQHSLDSQSYIYEALPHKTLSGKKMQKRRNHFNAFLKEYENKFTYRLVNKQDKDEISQLLDQWADTKTKDYAMEYEKHGILNILDDLDQLDFKMACIEIEGKIEAIILGSRINHNTVQIHVEKANKNIRGLYVAIFKFFLENEFDDILWVNREEDMGIESLRKAKQQLHPIKLLDQSFAYQNTDIVIRKAQQNDMVILKTRWLDTFIEDDEFFYHQYINKSNLDIYVLEMDHFIISIVYLRKMKMINNGKVDESYYIEGVSTHRLYKRQGFMKQLLNHIISLYKDKILFIQAYDWKIYDCFEFDGLIKKHLVTQTKMIPTEKKTMIKHGIDVDLFKKLYKSYMQKYDTYIERDLPIDIEGYEAIYHENAYALYAKFNNSIVITEIIYQTKEDAYLLINALINQYNEIKVICEPDLLDGPEIIFAKYFKYQLQTNSIYFNEYI